MDPHSHARPASGSSSVISLWIHLFHVNLHVTYTWGRPYVD